MGRDRRLYASLVVATIACGLASRQFGAALPAFVANYAGDTLWATMVFFVLAVVFRRQSTVALATASLAIAFAVEFSQMYRPDWLQAVRATRLGALALGTDFVWTDLLCYTTGVAIGAGVDWILVSRKRPARS